MIIKLVIHHTSNSKRGWLQLRIIKSAYMHFDFVQLSMVGQFRLAGKPKVLKNRIVREQTLQQQFQRQHTNIQGTSNKMAGRLKIRDIYCDSTFSLPLVTVLFIRTVWSGALHLAESIFYFQKKCVIQAFFTLA